MSSTAAALPTGRAHLAALGRALAALDGDVDRIDEWGTRLADVLTRGGRVLVAGNGGSAAQAEHLAAELVGRYRGERGPLSALALSAPGATVTALANDYGMDALFARQVEAHGRRGDILVALSTSGSSRNVLAAVEAAHQRGMTTWGLTGRAPNPLAACCDDAVCVAAAATATVQEIHQVVVHLLCAAFDVVVGAAPAAPVKSRHKVSP